MKAETFLEREALKKKIQELVFPEGFGGSCQFPYQTVTYLIVTYLLVSRESNTTGYWEVHIDI